MSPLRWLKVISSPWGRISRSTFWAASSLAFTIVAIPFVALVVWLARTGGNDGAVSDGNATIIGGLTLIIWSSATYILLVASLKRFNDRDKAGWWILIWCVPVAGMLWALLELGFWPGTSGRNRFGWGSDGRGGDIAAVFDQSMVAPPRPAGRAANVVALGIAWSLLVGSVMAWLMWLGGS